MQINQNYFKLQLLINKVTVKLRHIFMERWKLMYNKEWVNSKETVKEFIDGIGSEFYSKAKDLQKLALESGDINKWDFTLIAYVLQTIKFSISGQQNSEYSKQIRKENMNIEKLSSIRNKWAHNSNMSLTDEEFNQIWCEIVVILISFGESEEELELLKIKKIMIENHSNGDNQQNKMKAKQLKERGNQNFRKQEFTECIDNYSEALVLKGLNNQEIAILYSNRSIAYLKLTETLSGVKSGSMSGPIDHNDLRYKALLDAKKSLELSPFWPKAYHRIGCAYHSLNKFSKAIYNFDRALALEPTNNEIKSARDVSRYQLKAEQRFEHLEDRYSLQSTEEHLEKVNETGHNITRKQFEQMDKMFDKISKSKGDVSRGHRYYHGKGGYKQDFSMAAKFFGKAARDGEAEGMYNLALMLSKGEGVEQDHNLAINWLEKAAQQSPTLGMGLPNIGVAAAQHALGLFYESGIGVVKNPAIAMRWYLESSENGCGFAANNIGRLYSKGIGVEKNLLKAEQYFLLSASRKDPNSMLNLAFHYLKSGDIENARIWYKRAINNGSSFAKLYEEDFEEKVSEVEENTFKTLLEFESKNGLKTKGLTLEEWLSRMLTLDIPDGKKEIFHEFMNCLQTMKTVTLPEKLIEKNLYDLPTIDRYADNGSLFAQRMRTAMFYLFQSFNALEEFKVSQIELNAKNVSIIKFVQNYANSIRQEQLVVNLPLNMYSIADKLIDEVLKSEANKTSQLDIDARVCYTHSHSNSLDETILFLKECTKKYPNESYFYQICGCLYGFKQDFSKGLNELNIAFKLTPNDYEVLYNRATLMRLEGSYDPKDTIKAYMNFLEVAPKDHRKVPESYYSMAFCLNEFDENRLKKMNDSIKFSDESLLEMRTYYEKGLEAEKIQLPFFLPYQSNNKSLLTIHLKIFDGKHYNSEEKVFTNPTHNRTKKINSTKILTDPNRIQLIIKHRKDLLGMSKMKADNKVLFKYTTPALKQQKVPKSIVGLKPINLRDMDPTQDHIYEGFVITITFIEDAITGGASIRNLIEDENGNIQRCFIYNFEHENNDSIVQQIYGFGSKLYLINPYMRMCHDGIPAIRIDDPKSLIKISDEVRIENTCRYCGKENAKHVCSRCEKAYYCDKTCQTNDWKILKHKLVCKSLLLLANTV